jgi:predicted secreted protein
MLVCLVLALIFAVTTAKAQEFSPEYKAQLLKTAAARKTRNQAKNRADAKWRDKRTAQAQAMAQAQAEQQAFRDRQLLEVIQARNERKAGEESAKDQAFIREQRQKSERDKALGPVPSGYRKGLNGNGTYYNPGDTNYPSGYFSGGKRYEYGTGPNPNFGRRP